MATYTESGRLLFGGKSRSAMPWNPMPYMQEYLENLTADGRTTGYVNSAKVGLSHFANFCHGEGLQHPEEVTRLHIVRFQGHLGTLKRDGAEPLKLQYRQQLMKYVRNWINWLDELEYITTNPWQKIRIGQTIKKPKPLHDEELEALFDAHRMGAFALPPFTFHRREMILVLLYGWGLRIHELQALNVASMDMRQDWVVVRNKGGGQKAMPYATAMKATAQRWLTQRAKHAIVGEAALIIDRRGQRLSIDMIRKIVVELGDSASVPINPHRLRDTFATNMADNDVELERIMKLMGHTQRAQTLAYTQVHDRKVAESHERVMNPMLERLISGRKVS